MPFDDSLDDVIAEFLVESNENLDSLDQAFLVLEEDPTDRDTLAAVFRTMHSIKGASGFLGFAHLEVLTHAAEGLLSPLRDGAIGLTPGVTSALFQTVDAVRSMLSQIDLDRTDGDDDHAELLALLGALAAAPPAVAPAGPEPEAPRVPPIGELLLSEGLASPADVEGALAAQRQGDPRHLGEILVEQRVIEPADLVEVLKAQKKAAHAAAQHASTVRVDVALLDKLMNMVGELVLTRNQVLQHTADATDTAFVRAAQRLDSITGDLQAAVMKTRMQPIDSVWSKFPRMVRDLAVSRGTKVRLDMEGGDTELDKTVIEAIKDPLTHLVRNAVDHGIESPDARLAAGKSKDGRLSLRAYHEGGHVNIELADDGGGIDTDRVRAKAVA